MPPSLNFLIPAPILIPLGTAFILPIIGRVSRPLRGIVCVLSLLATLGILLYLGQWVFDGHMLVYWMSDWTPRAGLAIGISLSIDAWSLLIALIAAGIGLASVIYSIPFLQSQTGQGPYYVLMMLLITGLIGFALSGDLFNQFVWLEVFSVAAFALTAFNVDDSKAVEAAFKYLITNSVAAFFIAIGLALLYMQTGALNLAQIAQQMKATPAGLVAIGLLVGGYATKAALIPWHFWLPDAHSVAPAPVSALFSGALIKIGIYAVARNLLTLAPFALTGAIQTGLLVVASLTMLIGGIQMLQQQSVKRILAYSSVSQMGYILAGLSLGTPLALTAAALHTVHHALAKSALFLGAGAITSKTNIHDVDEGGNLVYQMPVTFVLMCLATLALAGFPFLAGFVSKTLLEESAQLAGAPLLVPVMVISSILTFTGLARLLWHLFAPRVTGNLVTRPAVKEAPVLMLIPIAVLLTISVLLGSQPAWQVHTFAEPAANALHNRENYITAVMGSTTTIVIAPHNSSESGHIDALPEPTDWHHLGIPLLVVVSGGLLAYVIMRPRLYHQRNRWAFHPIRLISLRVRQWHSGRLSDFVLWNAFGTAALMICLLLAVRFGLL